MSFNSWPQTQPRLDWIQPSPHHRLLACPTTKLCFPSPTYPRHGKYSCWLIITHVSHEFASCTAYSLDFVIISILPCGYVPYCPWSTLPTSWCLKDYLLLCTRDPDHVIQDLIAECPICQQDRLPLQPIPYPSSPQTLLHHSRSIGIDHVSVNPADGDGYVGLLLIVEHDTKVPYAYVSFKHHDVGSVDHGQYGTYPQGRMLMMTKSRL